MSSKKENWKKQQEDEVEAKRRDIDRQEAFLQRRLRAETIKRANDRLYEQTAKMKLLRGNLLHAEVIEVCDRTKPLTCFSGDDHWLVLPCLNPSSSMIWLKYDRGYHGIVLEFTKRGGINILPLFYRVAFCSGLRHRQTIHIHGRG